MEASGKWSCHGNSKPREVLFGLWCDALDGGECGCRWGGLPKDGDEGEWSRFKVSICVPVEPGRRCSSLHPAQRDLPASESARACVRVQEMSVSLSLVRQFPHHCTSVSTIALFLPPLMGICVVPSASYLHMCPLWLCLSAPLFLSFSMSIHRHLSVKDKTKENSAIKPDPEPVRYKDMLYL